VQELFWMKQIVLTLICKLIPLQISNGECQQSAAEGATSAQAVYCDFLHNNNKTSGTICGLHIIASVFLSHFLLSVECYRCDVLLTIYV